MQDNLGRTVYLPRTLRMARPDGYTYDACGRRLHKTDPSQLKDHDRVPLLYDPKVGDAEASLKRKSGNYQAQYTHDLEDDEDG